jgi:hypothetical protein
MSGTFRRTLAAGTTGLTLGVALVGSGFALASADHASATSVPKTLVGTVGPGFTINLTLLGKPVTKLKREVRYRVLINDRSSAHNFHLSGRGFDRELTTVGFTGTKSFVLTLKKGTYRFFCDPHAGIMHGGFRVT